MSIEKAIEEIANILSKAWLEDIITKLENSDTDEVKLIIDQCAKTLASQE